VHWEDWGSFLFFSFMTNQLEQNIILFEKLTLKLFPYLEQFKVGTLSWYILQQNKIYNL